MASSRERVETGNEEGTENEGGTENEEGTETGGTTAFQVPQFEGAQFEVPEPHEFPTTSLSKRLKAKMNAKQRIRNKDRSDDNTNDDGLEYINSLANVDSSLLENTSIFDVSAD